MTIEQLTEILAPFGFEHIFDKVFHVNGMMLDCKDCKQPIDIINKLVQIGEVQGIEPLGELSDGLENLVSALNMDIPAEVHVSMLKNTLTEKVIEIRQKYIATTYQNHWEHAWIPIEAEDIDDMIQIEPLSPLESAQNAVLQIPNSVTKLCIMEYEGNVISNMSGTGRNLILMIVSSMKDNPDVKTYIERAISL